MEFKVYGLQLGGFRVFSLGRGVLEPSVGVVCNSWDLARLRSILQSGYFSPYQESSLWRLYAAVIIGRALWAQGLGSEVATVLHKLDPRSPQ